jgi:hypothetical protein
LDWCVGFDDAVVVVVIVFLLLCVFVWLIMLAPHEPNSLSVIKNENLTATRTLNLYVQKNFLKLKGYG